jgi:predicted O-methyltransferase YrrM
METTRAFNEDNNLQLIFKKLVEKHNPDLILETGTYLGETTEYFCNFNIPVITTEINENFFNQAKVRLLQKYNNVELLLGDSEKVLMENFGKIEFKKLLCFLDSHNLNDTVLERELILLKKLKIKPILVIHDFYVPGKNFYFDTWDGHRYDYEFYKPYFDDLYGLDKYEHSYNEESVYSNAQGNVPVGVIILEPKK